MSPVTVALRLLVVASPIAVLLCTAPAGRPTPVVVFIAVTALAGWCARRPDTQAGLAVVALVALDWVGRVDDPTSPWSIAAAAGLGLFHTTMALAAVVPPAAALPTAVLRRWVSRWLVVLGASACTWVVAALLDSSRIDGGETLLATALVSLAGAIAWTVSRSIGGSRARPRQ